MDQQQAKLCADRFILALHQVEDGDPSGVDGLVAMFADDAQLTNPIIEREGGARVGRQEIADFWKNYRASFREIHSQFFDVTASDHAAGLFWRSTGTHVTGSALDYEGVSFLTFDEAGKIARFKGFFDSREVTARVQG